MDITSTGSRRAALVLASIGTMVWLLIAAAPALAHEFKVGILLTPGAEGTPVDSSFMDGFQLAVDQSPDVSHPPGPDAGDHLGGVDVEMIVVDDAPAVDGLAAAALDLIERESVVIIVANVPSATLQAVFDTLTESGTLLLAASGTDSDRFPTTPYFFAVGNQDEATDEAFESAFRETYERTPSPAVALAVGLTRRLIADR